MTTVNSECPYTCAVDVRFYPVICSGVKTFQLTDLPTKRRKDNANWLHQSKQYVTVSPLLQEYPTLTTFFAGEIISRKRPFLTRKWDADEDVDRKHWVSLFIHNLHRCFTVGCFTMT